MAANQAWIFRTTVTWNGDNVIKRLHKGALKGGAAAGQFYKSEVQRQLRKTKGSRALSGNLRLRIRHSLPGSIPFWQTGNLANSVKLTSDVGKGKGQDVHHFRIGSRVSYAVTLERGNPQVSIPQSFKKFNSIMRIIRVCVILAVIFNIYKKLHYAPFLILTNPYDSDPDPQH